MIVLTINANDTKKGLCLIAINPKSVVKKIMIKREGHFIKLIEIMTNNKNKRWFQYDYELQKYLRQTGVLTNFKINN